MKAEINKISKSVFFSLYWGQKRIEMVGYEELMTPYQANMKNDGRIPKLETKIHLKPIESITEEEAYYLGFRSDTVFNHKNIKHNSAREAFLITYKEMALSEILPSMDADYLRYKGYAVPFMGLLVEEMIEAGWIKLI